MTVDRSPVQARDRDRGPQHFLVGIAGGFALGLTFAVACGWWPL